MIEQIVERDGLKWSVRPDTDDHLAVIGHESWLAPVMRSLCPEGGLFIDIGAHVGTWALRMHHWGRAVTAVEPNPLTFQQLVHNCALNDIAFDMFQAAAWDSWDQVDLWDENGKESGGSTEALPGGTAGRGKLIATVRAIPAAIMVPRHFIGPCLIKMDVEGQEQRVLRGLEQALSAENRPNLLIELHGKVVGDDKLDANTIEMVRGLGYHVPDELPEWGACTYMPAQPQERVSAPS